MFSQRTNQLWDLYNKSRREDLNAWLPPVVTEEVQKYIKAKIRYVLFETSSEYDDNGGYYATLNSVQFYDENQDYIGIDDEDTWKEEYQEGGKLEGEVPSFDDLHYDLFNDIATDLREMGLDDVKIDLEGF